MFTRRHFLQSSTALTAGLYARPAMALLGSRPEPVPPIQDPRLKGLIDTSLTAARSAGATYADARLTFTDSLGGGGESPGRQQAMTFGVRALVDGYWGMASSPVWSDTEAARLGRSAVRHAKANVLGQPRAIELAPMTAMESGHWTMPVKDDPFEMHYDEIADFLEGLRIFIRRVAPPHTTVRTLLVGASFTRTDKAFGATTGQYCTQRLYRSAGTISWGLEHTQLGKGTPIFIDRLTPAGLGFELFRDQPLRLYIRQAFEEAMEELRLPQIPIDVGRYDTLIDAWGMASAVSQTIGTATEIDRAMGYEANAGGTSYITDVAAEVGAFKIGSPEISVTGNRVEPGAVGTVRWDDEGVTPREFTLVDRGILTDMQTNREGGGWLRPYYERTGKPVTSHGCAYAPDSIEAPLIHSANLKLQPDETNTATVETLRASMENGVELRFPRLVMDFQQMTGFGAPKTAFEIKKGKRTAVLTSAAMLFRTPELWGNVIDRGGESSVRQYGWSATKGQPQQTGYHSVSAVPALVKELTFIDAKRKA